jgi:hypothetical protein
VQHFLDRDAAQRLAPPVDHIDLIRGKLVIRLEAELGEQVLAHDHVLELGRLGEQPPQMLSISDDDFGLCHATILKA